MKPDTVIRNSPSWGELFQRLIPMKTKEKGDVFERVTQLYLQTHPEYQSKLSKVWMLNDVPKRVRKKFVRRHINWNNQRPDLKEDLARLVQDIRRRICGVASAGFPSFSV